jgi:DNA-binding GntR family transcriptional regulator
MAEKAKAFRRGRGQGSRRRPAGTEQSLRDKAYEAIKHRIITCALRPGEYVNELKVANLLGIGRTPVHQALARLRLEGMVDVIPRKGVLVKPLTLNEVLQIIEVRQLNEVYCVRLAAERADENDIADLKKVICWSRRRTSSRSSCWIANSISSSRGRRRTQF